jgi:hypothetical protein
MAAGAFVVARCSPCTTTAANIQRKKHHILVIVVKGFEVRNRAFCVIANNPLTTPKTALSTEN